MAASLRRAGAVVAFVVACTAVGWANGEEFFGSKDTKLDLYYFGHIKDTSGKVLDNAIITIFVKNAEVKFPFRNDAPGHFRSPDIGKAIKGLGLTIDPAQVEIVVSRKGYTMVRPVKVPSKIEGGVGPLDFVMAPVTVAAN